MTQFQRAQPHELPELTTLWQTCFGDSEASIQTFWRQMFDHIHVFTARTEGTLAAMLCALPVTLVCEDGDTLPAAYFYAVCTAPDKRGHGLCRALMQHAEAALHKEGISIFTLVPSSAELFDFYQNFGYQTVFFHDAYSVSAARGAVKIKKINADAYRNLRQMQLYDAFLSYDLPLLTMQQTMSESSGGGLFRLETDELVCCAAAEKSGDTLLIKELLPDCPEAAAALAFSLGCSQAELRTAGASLPFGMCKAAASIALPRCAYLGLALD